MGELKPVIEGATKYRDGKKWKTRFARVTRLSPVADSLTLQLWRDEREVERGLTPTKGSINLANYLGFESSFNLDKESNTLALIFKQMVIILALDIRETLIKWQVRLTNQFEEGMQIAVHLVTCPKKAKLSQGPMRIHLQNLKFSLTAGVPPVLVHSWNMLDLRRYGAVEGGRFCFEGGTRCGRGEGLHVFRVDNAEDIQICFNLASKGKLENKKRPNLSGYTMSTSPSMSSNLSSQKSDLSGSSLTALLFQSNEELERSRSRSQSRSVITSFAGWSSLEAGLALNSPDTMSLTVSEIEGENRLSSPDHLVSRRTILERIGIGGGDQEGRLHSMSHAGSRSCGSEEDFHSNWTMERGQQGTERRQQVARHTPLRRQGKLISMDRLSVSSGESTYDHPKTVLKVTSSPRSLERNSSAVSMGSTSISSARDMMSPSLVSKSLRRAMSERARLITTSLGGDVHQPDIRRMIAATPCACGQADSEGVQDSSSNSSVHSVEQLGTGYENYDIPRNLGRQEAMQFYDTPRNVREAIESSQHTGPLANYDIPTAGPLPVFRKPCGCIMKLVSNGGQEPVTLENLASNGNTMTWTCVREADTPALNTDASDLNIPRVKLTGQGKMPVVDMSKVNAFRCLSEPPQTDINNVRPLSPQKVTGLPPKHPLYAQIDKTRKQCPACVSGVNSVPHQCSSKGTSSPARQSQVICVGDPTNYTNLDFANSLCLYENSKDVLARLETLPSSSETNNSFNLQSQLPIQTYDTISEVSCETDLLPKSVDDKKHENYLNMSPNNDYEIMNIRDEPLLDFSPVNGKQSPIWESNETLFLMGDSKFNTIKHMPKICQIDKDSLVQNVYQNDILISDLTSVDLNNLTGPYDTRLSSGFVTIPRSGYRISCAETKCPTEVSCSSSSGSGSTVVSMRRSVSVPCKRDRDSISSGGSDSGVSTGSPRLSMTEQLELDKEL